VSFPDNPNLVDRPKRFASDILKGDLPDDIQPYLNNLLGFARGFYLQYFKMEHGLEVRAFNARGRRLARSVEASTKLNEPSRQLVSHYLTIASTLEDNRGTSDELPPDEARDEVLSAILELLARIAAWAEHAGLTDLVDSAKETHGIFRAAVARLN
jgi:hypothetical protein